MSWNGAATGVASFQQPPYSNGYPGQAPFPNQPTPQYGQQPGYSQYQSGFSHPQPGAPPPPPKSFPPKKKGNPVITRYPPPPGYRGPAQPQGPFGTVQYPTPQQGYSHGPTAPAPYPTPPYQGPSPTQGYSPQGYGPPQSHPSQQGFPQSGYQPTQNYHWPQQQPQSYPQPPVSQSLPYPASQHYSQQQPGYQQYPNQPPPINTNQPAWPNTQGWPQTPGSATYPPPNQYNSYGVSPANSQPTTDPNATPTPSSANPAFAQSTPTNTQPPSATSEVAPEKNPPLFLGWDDWDFDFDGAIWPKANEPVDPDLSLGVITWRPAKQVTRALPATFAEAEEQSLKPPAERLGNGESVSLYFAAENSYEAFLDVRKTDEWYNIKDDPAFVVFTEEEMERNLVSIESCLSLRDRPDENEAEVADKGNEHVHDPAWNVMDNLEQALSGDMEDVKKPTPIRPALNTSRDQIQEDILARLGVTGSPKPPSGEAPPLLRDDHVLASLPPKPPAPPSTSIPPRPEVGPHRAQSYGGHRNSTYGTAIPRPYGSMSSATSLQSLPVQNDGRTNIRPSNLPMQPHGNGVSPSASAMSPAHSEGSNKTAVGPGFGTEEAAHPQLNRSDSSSARKRSYEDTDQDGHTRQQDDHTKRKRRSQVDAAYR
ncbi:uncharacterized protein N0V89_007692 [Didymosphaeria variabile]|uniref:Uncharacterized protein n=1 Tax=Didymosphaeria variabile TaxID=1932322 RepID=A0A9W9C9Q6_9PLEO|nr:uncharacterized protein N0V89_007692 [Didymosphaeria variabile]KAJ4352344.1 hypothetical protein N0V89_007692 [Didymosphaeria variabile]